MISMYLWWSCKGLQQDWEHNLEENRCACENNFKLKERVIKSYSEKTAYWEKNTKQWM